MTFLLFHITWNEYYKKEFLGKGERRTLLINEKSLGLRHPTVLAIFGRRVGYSVGRAGSALRAINFHVLRVPLSISEVLEKGGVDEKNI